MTVRLNAVAEDLAQNFFRLYPEEAAQALSNRSPTREVPQILDAQTVYQAATIMERFPLDFSAEVILNAGGDFPQKMLSALDPLKAALILARLDPEFQEKQFSLLDPKRVRLLKSIMTYPSDSAGNLMDPQFLSFPPETSVKNALTKLRALKGKRIYDLLVVDGDGKLLGVIPLQKLAVSPANQPLGALYQAQPVSVHDMANRQEVLDLMEQFKVNTLPVVNLNQRVLGIIQQDSLVVTAQEEVSADIQTMVGASKEERALSKSTFAVRKRLPWLQINLLTAFLAAAVVGLFESTIAQFTALAVLLPVVAGQSGNTGAQALAVTMRGLTLREIRVYQWFQVLIKETQVGFINGCAVAATTSFAVFIWSQSTGLAMIIGFSMVLSMIAAGIAGVAVPMILTAMGQDPAQSSSIILTTVTDVVGFFSFLGIATLLAGSI